MLKKKRCVGLLSVNNSIYQELSLKGGYRNFFRMNPNLHLYFLNKVVTFAFHIRFLSSEMYSDNVILYLHLEFKSSQSLNVI